MDAYVIMTEGYTDCALVEAILNHHMGYRQYRKKGDMPGCLQKLVGEYPGLLGELEVKDTPHFYYKGEKAVVVKTAQGFTNIVRKLVLVMDALLSADDASDVKGAIIICDADLPDKTNNRQRIEEELKRMEGISIDEKKGTLSYQDLEIEYDIYVVPQTGNGAVEKVLLQILGRMQSELAACSEEYRKRIMDETFAELRMRWAKDEEVKELMEVEEFKKLYEWLGKRLGE